MSTIKIIYFDLDGGRAEPIRLALSIANTEFEDKRISFPEFGELKSTLPLGAVPVAEIDGETYTQCNALNRYFGKQAGLYPDDAWQAFLCDEVMDIIEDASNALGKTMGLQGDALKAAREELASGKLASILRLLNKRLEDAGSEYFADSKLTMADLKMLELLGTLTSGFFDHIPTDIVQKQAPLLVTHMQKVMSDQGVSAYYQKRSQ